MIRRDYILRMVEEFAKALARIRSLKQTRRCEEARAELERQTGELCGLSCDQLVRLSETELFAAVCKDEPTQTVRTKILLLTTALNEAGDIAAERGDANAARQFHLKALDVLLATLAREDVFDLPDFVPAVEEIASKLAAAAPFGTLSMLMYHYERTGQFAKAEDALFAMGEAAPAGPAFADFGNAFYQRVLATPDDRLAQGNLPRTEASEGAQEFQRRFGRQSN
jgi:hypothetical protein